MSTSVTKRYHRRASVNLTILSLFLVIFNQVYESFSYGESSAYMRWAFLWLLLGAGCHLLTLFGRLTFNKPGASWFLHAGLATLVSGCLVKGIIEISGRTTQLDQPYWWVGLGLLVISSLLALRKIRD